jgi:ribose transport system permease protein
METKETDKRINIREVLKKQGLVIAFIAIMVILSMASSSFLTYQNITLVMRQVAIFGIIACGMTFVIIGGNFDLSVGSLVSLTTVIVISLHDTLGPVPAIIVALLVGLAAGAFNGYLVGFLKLNSMIITLGMLGVLQAITLIYTGGKYSSIANPEGTWYAFVGRGFFMGVPFPIFLYIIITIVFATLLNKTVYGRQLMAVGGNPIQSGHHEHVYFNRDYSCHRRYHSGIPDHVSPELHWRRI